MKWFVFFLLMLNFVSAVGIDFDCPNDIFVDEEFECSLEVFDGDGEYDVKIDLDEERDSVLQFWNDEKWVSGYYYLKEFIKNGEEENILLKISEEGDYDGILKLRQDDKREFFDICIDVEENEMGNVGVEEVTEVEGIVLLKERPLAISLNNDTDEDVLVFVSKDARVIDYLPYGFSLFLIFVIVVLLWERF